MPFPDIPAEVELSYLRQHLTEDEVESTLACYDNVNGKLRKRKGLSEQEQENLRRILFSHNHIFVADNGTGMTEAIVRSAWMYIGTSNKEYNIRSGKERVKTGAKGIGRFALDKLTVKSVMLTSAKAVGKVIKWSMDWDQLANVRFINEVKAELDVWEKDYRETIKEVLDIEQDIFTGHDWLTGTLIALNPVREAWSERLFKKVNTNLKSINPIGSADRYLLYFCKSSAGVFKRI